MNVGRYFGWLNGRQVGSVDQCIGEHIAHLDGPIADAGGHVEDGAGLREGSKIELVLQKHLDGLTLELEALLFREIIGKGVCW